MMPQPVDSICDPRRIFITEIEILCSEFREKTSCPLTLVPDNWAGPIETGSKKFLQLAQDLPLNQTK